MDPYLALIGGTPTDQEKQAALASQLRRDTRWGQLGAMTGDTALSPFGQNLIKSSQAQAETLGSNRQAEEKQRALQQYYDAQIAQMQGKSDLDVRKFEYDQQRDLASDELEREKLANALKVAESKQKSAGYEKLRTSDINALKDAGTTLTALMAAEKMLQNPDFDPGQTSIPMGRTALNTAAQYGYGTKDSKAVQNWWGNLNRFYTLPERNALFGATLTPNEQRAWAEASISPEMDKEQIQEKMNVLIEIYKSTMERMQSGYIDEGYNPDAIYSYSGRSMRDQYYEGTPAAAPSGDDLPQGVTVTVKK